MCVMVGKASESGEGAADYSDQNVDVLTRAQLAELLDKPRKYLSEPFANAWNYAELAARAKFYFVVCHGGQ